MLMDKQLKEDAFYPYHRPPWGLAEVVVVIVLVYLCGIGFGFYSTRWLDRVALFWGLNTRVTFLLMAGFLQAVLLGGFVLAVVRLRKASPAALGLRGFSWHDVFIYGAMGGVGVFFLVSLLMVLIISFLPHTPPPQPIAELIANTRSWREVLLPLLLVGVFAPLSEELYFRGFVYPVLRSRTGVAGGIILTACFFGGLHFDPIRFLPLSLGGAFLTLLCEKTGSLYPSLFAHSIWNILMTAIAFLLNQTL